MGDINVNDETNCFIYLAWKNVTAREYLTLGYEGIPQNLVLNVIGWFIMIVLFSFLRKKAWNYGRIAFDHRRATSSNGRPYSDVLFGGTSNEGCAGNYNTSSEGQNQSSQEILIDDRGMFSWIITTFKLTDEQIRAKSGSDAVHYLSFQRHLIFIGSVIMTVSIVIVLPINFQGGNTPSNVSEFQSSTIKNLGESGKLLWVHVALTIAYLIVTVAVLRHFSKRLAFAERDPIMSRTVMISRIAKKNSRAEQLENHFVEIYPDVEIDEISFAYNISRLQSAELCKLGAASARAYWESYLELKKRRPKMRPYVCGNLLCCCSACGLKSGDAIEYYKKEEERYTKFVEIERQRALSLPLGIAFVTFQTVDMAHRVVTDFRLTARCFKLRPNSTYSRTLKSNRWHVNFAPLPEDLYWENLSLSYGTWYFKAILVNIVLILFICIYSTPVFVLNAVNKNLKLKESVSRLGGLATGGLATDTAPTMLLWVTAVTLPSLVSVSDRIVGFWTKTAENRSRMVKTFTFLLFMVIILPSLGAQSFIGHIYNTASKQLSLKCIFYTGNGVFFVNYVITSSFLGTASELMRLHELFYYSVKLLFAKSAAEIDSIRKSVLWDFQFGSQYAWCMLNFTMFVIFSLICPIITPFGLVYVIMKHYVDRYNIYFAYAPCKVDKEVHVTAINFVVVTMFLLQIIMLAYIISYQDDTNKLLKVFSILGFCITAAFFIGQVFFNMCTNFSPISYQKIDSLEGLRAGAVNGGVPYNEETPLESSAQLEEHGVTRITVDGAAAAQQHRYDRRRLLLNHQRYFPKILRPAAQSQQAAVEYVPCSTGIRSSKSNNNSHSNHIATNTCSHVGKSHTNGISEGKRDKGCHEVVASQVKKTGNSPTPV